MRSPNAQYNVAEPDSLALKATLHMRRKMFTRFVSELNPKEHEAILDVGATSDKTYESSNYLEAWYPHKSRITATGVDDASHLEALYPGVRFVAGNGKALPFSDGEFDVVHSAAVLEHVGSQEEQVRFIAELWRVARRGIFLTTPNRWFPVEVHTSIPLLHWLPVSAYRALLRRFGLSFFADEANLNLLGRGDVVRLCRRAGIADARISSVRLLGWPSNLVVSALKRV
jgi:hypothetical protein